MNVLGARVTTIQGSKYRTSGRRRVAQTLDTFGEVVVAMSDSGRSRGVTGFVGSFRWYEPA